MRLHFHLVNGTQALPDEAGIEVADLERARTEAMQTLAALREEKPITGLEWAGWRLEVADRSGAVLFTISLDVLNQ